MSKSPKLRWKFTELIDALGGPKATADLISKRGIAPPPIETIKGWRYRNVIPSDWLPLIIMIAQEEKKLLRNLRGLWGGVE